MIAKQILLSVGAGLALLPLLADGADARARLRFTYHPYGSGYYSYYPGPFYRPAPRYYYYAPEPLYDRYDPDYYEPRYYDRKRRQPTKNAVKTAPAQEQTAKPAAKPATKPAAAKPAIVKPAAAQPEAVKPAAAKPKVLSCAKATQIVSDYGFGNVKASDCNGTVYIFDARRDGKPFTVKLSSVSGELTSVAKR